MDLKDFHASLPHQGKGALAKAAGCSVTYLYCMATKRAPVSKRYAEAIEAATRGRVTRQEMRPNDWFLLWPELSEPAPQIHSTPPQGASSAPTLAEAFSSGGEA